MSNINIPKIDLLKDKNQVRKLKNYVKKKFLKHGIIEFSNLPYKEEKIQEFTNLFTDTYSNDAQRRTNKFKNTKINSVDLGNHFIPLHSEASFTYSCPEIIWFYCSKNDNLGAPTTICDGKNIWSQISEKTKQFFLKNPILFKVEIDIPFKKFQNFKQNYFTNKIGVFDSYINWKKGKFCFSLIKFVINEDYNTNSFFFANHVLVGSENEKQIKKMTLTNGKKIPKNIILEIEKICRKLTINYKWKKNKLLMINNRRFMHGRNKFRKNSNREILNIQTLKANFRN